LKTEKGISLGSLGTPAHISICFGVVVCAGDSQDYNPGSKYKRKMSSPWNLPPAAEKRMAEINKKIDTQKSIIEKEKAVVAAQEDSFVCKRAKVSLSNLEVKKATLDSKLEAKKKELTDAFNEVKKQYQEDIKIAQENRDTEEKELDMKIKVQLSTITSETEKKSKCIIRAEKDIELLQAEKKKILQASGITIESPLTPPPQTQEYEPVTVNMDDFFREGRSDGQPMGKPHAYLDSPRYYEKDVPGVGNISRRPTIYGAVRNLEKVAQELRRENKS
jgi:hypothetical protein